MKDEICWQCRKPFVKVGWKIKFRTIFAEGHIRRVHRICKETIEANQRDEDYEWIQRHNGWDVNYYDRSRRWDEAAIFGSQIICLT